MVTLEDVVDVDALAGEVEAGYVARRQHPRLPLQIFNYTAQAQFENRWTPETRACRGLIIELLTHRVLARPFPKFFNLGQEGAAIRSGEFRTYDKVDGSLGILYPTPDGRAIATRGSFDSDQAKHASAVWADRYEAVVPYVNDVTLLFEIVYPANRIVVDYGGMDDLVLLAVIENATGRDLTTDLGAAAADVGWPGKIATPYALTTLDEVELQAQSDDVDEGFVLVWEDGSRVKVKTPEYLRLHRLVTGMTPRRIWELLAAGVDLDPILASVPDEFQKWALDVCDDLTARYDNILEQARAEEASVRAFDLPDRKAVAEVVKKLDQPLPGLVFALLDGKGIADRIWRLVKPSGAEAFRAVSEDVA